MPEATPEALRRLVDRLTEAAAEHGEHQQVSAERPADHGLELQQARARGRTDGLREALLLVLDADYYRPPPF